MNKYIYYIYKLKSRFWTALLLIIIKAPLKFLVSNNTSLFYELCTKYAQIKNQLSNAKYSIYIGNIKTTIPTNCSPFPCLLSFWTAFSHHCIVIMSNVFNSSIFKEQSYDRKRIVRIRNENNDSMFFEYMCNYDSCYNDNKDNYLPK